VGGQGGQDGDGFHTTHPNGNDGQDGSTCAGGPITHSGSFTTLAPGQGEPTIPPFPSGGGSTGSGGGGGTGGGGTGGGGSPAPTPTPKTTPAPIPLPSPIPKPLHFLTLHTTKLVASRGGDVAVKATCPAGGATCAEKLALTTTAPVHGSAATAAKKKRTVKLGSARVSIPAGRTAKVHIKLDKAGRTLLAKTRGHRLEATVKITAGQRTHRLPVRLALARR
jgi:hypothetical protein